MHDTDPTTHALDVLWLDDARARRAEVAGAKAANLAEAHHAGLPALPGFVLTTDATATMGGMGEAALADALEPARAAWERLSGHGERPLVVRSSSVGEDTGASSMAGRFTSVLRVRGWTAFVDAVGDVLASAGGVAAETDDGEALPMAVLVQPQRDALLGGVLFGIDPLTGDTGSILVSMVEGPPEDIVSGAVDGTTVVLSPRGRIRSARGSLPDAFDRALRRRLVRLADVTGTHFGGPQDVEWLVDATGTLVLLQSRPVTASAVPAPRSHLLGPGPVAETFPDPLARLERDLWMVPLEAGIVEALRISGARNRRLHPVSLAEPATSPKGERLRGTGGARPSGRGDDGPVVVDVGGRVAVDLERLGIVAPPRGFWSVFDPRPGFRRLRAAWRMGRLRGALPAIASDLVEETDAALRAVPAPEALADHDLVTVLRTTRRALGGLHAHEILAGLLLEPTAEAPSGASVALAELARGRLDGLDDAQVVARSPVVLALVPPRIGGPGPVERIGAMATAASVPQRSPDRAVASEPRPVDPTALAREALRLRVRWVHELQVRVAVELGARLVARGQVEGGAVAAQVRDVALADLVDAVEDPTRTIHLETTEELAAPLPARFRLSSTGAVVADVGDGGGSRGVSPGLARAPVTHDPADAAGQVLVVPALVPELAPVLSSVAALVAESGSPLSHLAILAREQAVPTVVGMEGATRLLRDGEVVVVDGASGEVRSP